MIVDALLDPDLTGVASAAAALEAIGVEGLWAPETTAPAWSALLLAAEHTGHVRLGSCVSVAFARTPMALAYEVAAVHRLAPGRVVVGLGTQTEAHVTRRFGMPWSSPADRMEEYVAALRAIWASWATGRPLRFRGEHYRHTLMTPYFVPPVGPHPDLEVLVAAVGERLAAAAGAVGDGLLFHLLATPRYLAETLLPAFDAGLARSGRTRSDVTVAGVALVATGEEAVERLRYQIAFYAATPNYLPMLRAEGLEDLHTECRQLALRGRWEALASVVSDDVVHRYAVVAEPAVLAERLRERYGAVADRVAVALPVSSPTDVATWRGLLTEAGRPQPASMSTT